MFVVAVANLKGGSGKTTVATHLAAAYARAGHRVILGDMDRQLSSVAWVGRRPSTLPLIETADLDADDMVVPTGPGRTVIDVPGGMRRKALEIVVKAADALVVPVLPSAFDEGGTARFLQIVHEFKPVRRGRRPIALVANRLRPRTKSGAALESWLATLDHPVVTRLSDAQPYVLAASTGETLFDGPRPSRALLAEWAPLLTFLDDLAKETAHADW